MLRCAGAFSPPLFAHEESYAKRMLALKKLFCSHIEFEQGQNSVHMVAKIEFFALDCLCGEYHVFRFAQEITSQKLPHKRTPNIGGDPFEDRLLKDADLLGEADLLEGAGLHGDVSPLEKAGEAEDTTSPKNAARDVRGDTGPLEGAGLLNDAA